MAKLIHIQLSWKSRLQLFKFKWFGRGLWKLDLITKGRWFVFKSFFKDVKELFFPKKDKLGALFG